MRQRALIVEADPAVRRSLQQIFEVTDLAVDSTESGREVFELLERHGPSYCVFVLALDVPRLDGLRLVEEVQRRGLATAIIALVDGQNFGEAVEVLRRNVFGFLSKPADPERLARLVQDALRQESSIQAPLPAPRSPKAYHGMISADQRMLEVFDLIEHLGNSKATVLIEGETGTGKELVARAIHEVSDRQGLFVPVNCASLPQSLLESELFGHERGAFTGATTQRIGRFELADTGTLFLDEMGEIPPGMQAKLLRVLQERQIERVGGAGSLDLDVRLIGATNAPLQELMLKGKFRSDLYYRMNVLCIELPALRERGDDIEILAQHFARRYANPTQAPKTISDSAMKILLNYRWPGNVRELDNVMQRVSVVVKSDTIEPEHLPTELLRQSCNPMSPLRVDLNRPLRDLIREVVSWCEYQYLRKALKKTRGNVSQCARICGLSRRSIHYKIAEHKLDKTTFKRTAP